LTLLGQTNLVYYHWEITAERLKLLPQLTQLALMVTRHRQLDAQSAAGKWLAAVGPTLGNSVTEVTQTAPNQLTFVRKASGGLTAVELTALANWLETPNFPGCDCVCRRQNQASAPENSGTPPVQTLSAPSVAPPPSH